jgi:nucleotide-binding universal stress UspA family protein
MADQSADIVVGIDFSPSSELVLLAAADLARGLGARLHVVHAAAPEPTFVGYDRPGGPRDRDERASELTDEHRQLHDLVETIDGVDVIPLLVMGATVDVLLDEARRHDATTIVVGSHGHGALRRLLVGSTADALLRHCDRPVLVVPVLDR